MSRLFKVGLVRSTEVGRRARELQTEVAGSRGGKSKDLQTGGTVVESMTDPSFRKGGMQNVREAADPVKMFSAAARIGSPAARIGPIGPVKM